MRISKKKSQLNQRTFRNLQLHLVCWHTKICTLNRHNICESLVKIQHFKPKWLSIMFDNTKKKHTKIKRLPIICSYIWNNSTLKFAYWFNTYSVEVWWRYVLPNTNTVHFCDISFRHRAVLPTCPKNNIQNQKADHVRIISSH